MQNELTALIPDFVYSTSPKTDKPSTRPVPQSFVNKWTQAQFFDIENKMKSSTSGIEVHDRKTLFRTYPKCFVGEKAVDWMLDNLSDSLHSRTEAVYLGTLLLNSNVFHQLGNPCCNFCDDDSYYYRFEQDEEHSAVLNLKKIYNKETIPLAHELSFDLLLSIIKIVRELKEKDTEFSLDVCSWSRIKKTVSFNEFITLASELHRIDISNLTDDKKIIFWVNMFNTLMLHGILYRGGIAKAFARKHTFYNAVSYIISEFTFSLADIKHGILRGNKRVVGIGRGKQFRSSDPRLQFRVIKFDPRIHFVIHCYTKSSPPLSILNEANCETAMQKSTEKLLKETIVIDSATTMISIPPLFDAYGTDFGKDPVDVIQWVFKFLTPNQQKSMDILSTLGYVSIKFLKYNCESVLPLRLFNEKQLKIIEAQQPSNSETLETEQANKKTETLATET